MYVKIVEIFKHYKKTPYMLKFMDRMTGKEVLKNSIVS